MIIQWDSGAAQETVDRMRKAENELQDCLRQVQTVRAALEAANPDGESKLLNEVRERIDTCDRRLKRLLDDVEAYGRGTRNTNARFEEAERSLVRMVEGSDASKVFGGTGGLRWEPEAYAVTPNMRVRVAPVPAWLENAVADGAALE